MRFKGKSVLVTGAARRIGRAISLAFAQAGADIVAHYNHSAKEAEELAREIRSMGRNCLLSSHDMSDSESTQLWFTSLLKQSGKLDILVNSASEYSDGGYDSLKAGALERSMAIHVLSPIIMIQTMHRQGHQGAVVNMLDTRITDRDDAHAAYHMAKRNLFTLTRDLAVTMAPLLRINAVAPGIILPPPGKDEAWIERMKFTNPMKKSGSVADVVDAVIYLAAARFVTGVIIYVDGGRHIKGNTYGL